MSVGITKIGVIDPASIPVEGEWSHSLGKIRDYWAICEGSKMFVNIKPGGFVHEHTDHGLKLHIVLNTNDDAKTTVGGEVFHMEQGGVYLMDASLPHSSVNNGSTDRIHLVIS